MERENQTVIVIRLIDAFHLVFELTKIFDQNSTTENDDDDDVTFNYFDRNCRLHQKFLSEIFCS